MKVGTDRIHFLTQLDCVCDYIPFVSTVSNLVDLFYKTVVIPRLQPETLSDHYWEYLAQKSVVRCVALLVPVLGNLFIALKDIFWNDSSSQGGSLNRDPPLGRPDPTIQEAEDLQERVGDVGVTVLQRVGEVAENVTYSLAKKTVKVAAYKTVEDAVLQVAPDMAGKLPGLGALTATYKIGRAVFGAESVEDAIEKGTDAATDAAIHMACSAAGQAAIPIPIVGGVIGSFAAPYVIEWKNWFFGNEMYSGEPEVIQV